MKSTKKSTINQNTIVKISSSQRRCFSLSHSPTRQKLKRQKDFFFFSFAAMFFANEQCDSFETITIIFDNSNEKPRKKKKKKNKPSHFSHDAKGLTV
jgi:hypothetical protein